MKRRVLLGGALSPFFFNSAATAGLPSSVNRPALLTPLAANATFLAATKAGKRLVIAGERGLILWSDDNGLQWKQASVPVQLSITSLAFRNDREGWAAGHFGVLLRTFDAGATWQLAMDGVRAAQITLDQALDDAAREQAAAKLKQGADKAFFDLAFVNDRLLAFGAYGLAIETIDGKAFTSLTQRLPNPKQLHVYGVSIQDKNIYAVGEQGLILRSTDAGLRFESLPAPYKGSFFGVVSASKTAIIAYGLRGTIFRSEDAGATWVQIPNPIPISINTGIVLADSTVALVAQNGDVLMSKDAGKSFERLSTTPPFPTAAVVATADKHLLLAGLRGVRRVALA